MNSTAFSQYVLSLQFFSQILQKSPDEDFFKALAQDDLFQEFSQWECFSSSACGALPEFGEVDAAGAIARLATAHGAAAVKDEGFYSYARREAHLDHLHLFSGPNPVAAPWESVWRERDKLLFGEQTEKVYRFYKAWGVCTEKSGKEPEDHLGLELAFALFLLQAMHGEPKSASADGASAKEALLTFLDEHVLPWADACLHAASRNANTVFYRETATLCSVMLHNLRGSVATAK